VPRLAEEVGKLIGSIDDSRAIAGFQLLHAPPLP
jgi:hypothetical protein